MELEEVGIMKLNVIEVEMQEPQQISLFDISKYSSRKLRGHYKKKEIKEERLNPYLEISQIYSQIANYLPIPIMTNGQERFNYEHLTLWYSQYNIENYLYQGEEFIGEDFKIIGAELKGTENMFINERLYLHRKLLELIKNGLSVYEAAERIQPLIKKFIDEGIILELDYGES